LRILNPPRERKEDILIGSSISLEELVCVRKQLLLEAFEKEDRRMEGQVSQRHWLQVMTDVLDVSMSWRRLARYLIKEEMTVVDADHCLQIKYVDFLNSFDDDIIFGRYRDDEESIHNMHALSRYIQSAGSEHNEADFSIAEILSPDEVVPEMKDNANTPDKSTASMACPSSGAEQPGGSQAYFGHLVSKDAIAAIYSGYEKIEEAFHFFDADADARISMDDFIQGCTKLNLAAEISTGSGEAESPPSSSGCYGRDDLQRLIGIMDVYDCGEIDVNVFFEMFRLSLLIPALEDDRNCTKPLLAREASHAHDLYRLSHSHFPMPSTPLFGGGSSPGHPLSIVASQLSATGSLELKKGVEIAVDTELTASGCDTADPIGLPIDI
jgi:Ca2+-binding EF-hand superfamily protein